MHLNITIAAMLGAQVLAVLPSPFTTPSLFAEITQTASIMEMSAQSGMFLQSAWARLYHALKMEHSLFNDHKDQATVHCTPLMLWGKTQTNSQLTFSKVLNLPL